MEGNGAERVGRPVGGLHHITCIAGNPQTNLDFYAGVLGMRLVKRSVNQDDVSAYHFFFADAVGHPGTDLTFFTWPHLPPWRPGVGLAVEVQLAVAPQTLGFWRERLERFGVRLGELEMRFGEPALVFSDPDGLPLALVEAGDASEREFAPWERSPVPARFQVRGLHGARVWERALGLTAEFLTEVLGFEPLGQEAGWARFGVGGGGSGRFVELQERPDSPAGEWGVGAVHHLAWRVTDDEHQRAVRARVEAAGRPPTPIIDRFWFRSVYFREPGGVLFELATDGPGFTVDEEAERLGESLVLPPWLEPHRRVIEAGLPAVRLPRGQA